MISIDIIVRFSDCDALGHVNNAVYYTYFEASRRDLFRIFNSNLDIRSWNITLASSCCDFLQESFYAQMLTVYAWIGRLGTSSFVVEHAIKDDKGAWVARGRVTHLKYDFKQKMAVPLSQEERDKLLIHHEGPTEVPGMRNLEWQESKGGDLNGFQVDK